MAITSFREPLPEDRLSEEERDKRIHIFDQFSKKLKKEMRTAAFEDRNAIRQLLVYVGKRLDLLDVENRYGRAFKRFDFLLGHTTKPVPQDLIGVAANAALDLGRKDTESLIGSHQLRAASLIAEISMLAPAIDKLLDQRPSLDKVNYVLRPSSCLPVVEVENEDAPSYLENTSQPAKPDLPKPELANGDEPLTKIVPEAQTCAVQSANKDDSGGAAPADIGLAKTRPNNSSRNASTSNRKPTISDEHLRKEWLDSKRPVIEHLGKSYPRHFIANRIQNLKYLTIRRRVAAVLWFGYGMDDSAIHELMGIARRTVFDHRRAAESEMAKDPSMEQFLKSYKRKARIKNEEDASGLD